MLLSTFFTALWEYQTQHKGVLPHDAGEAAVLEQTANTLLSQADVNKQAVPSIPKELVEYVRPRPLLVVLMLSSFTRLVGMHRTMAVTASHELSPVCAVVGGMLAQDMLKALAARESPIVNFFVFDGHTGGGTVCRMNVP